MKNKVILSFCLTILIVILFGFTAVFKMVSLANLTDKLYQHPYLVTTATKTIESHFISMHRYMKDVALAQSTKDIENAVEHVNESEKIIYEQFQIIFERYLGNRKDIETSYNVFKSWKPIRDEVITLMYQGKKTEAANITKKEGALHVKNLNKQINTLVSYAQNKASFFHTNAIAEKNYSIILLLCLLSIVLILVGALLFYLIRNINKSEKEQELLRIKKEQDSFMAVLREEYVNNENLKSICDKSLNHIINYFHAINGTLYLFDSDNEKLYLGATYGIKYTDLKHTLTLHENLISENIIERKVKIKDVQTSVHLGTIEVHCTKLVTIPILEFDKSIGTVQLLFDDAFSKVDLEFLEKVLSLMATYIFKAQIDDEAKRYLKLIDKNVLISKTDLDGNIIEVSEQLCELSKYTRDELLGKTHRVLRHPDMPESLYKDLWSTITCGETWKGDIKNRTKDGGFYWISSIIAPDCDVNGNVIGYTAIRTDITDKKTIEEIAITDSLTSLYNRRHFDTVFEEQIHINKRTKNLLAFLIIDIDYFKQYNDKYGHQEGDQTLQDVAMILKTTLQRPTDYSFRLGGEEFGLLYSIDKKESALIIANKIKMSVENLKIEHLESLASKYVTISAGLYIIQSDDINSSQEIYKKADFALYHAKQNGRNQVSISK